MGGGLCSCKHNLNCRLNRHLTLFCGVLLQYVNKICIVKLCPPYLACPLTLEYAGYHQWTHRLSSWHQCLMFPQTPEQTKQLLNIIWTLWCDNSPSVSHYGFCFLLERLPCFQSLQGPVRSSWCHPAGSGEQSQHIWGTSSERFHTVWLQVPEI